MQGNENTYTKLKILLELFDEIKYGIINGVISGIIFSIPLTLGLLLFYNGYSIGDIAALIVLAVLFIITIISAIAGGGVSLWFIGLVSIRSIRYLNVIIEYIHDNIKNNILSIIISIIISIVSSLLYISIIITPAYIIYLDVTSKYSTPATESIPILREIMIVSIFYYFIISVISIVVISLLDIHTEL